MPIDAAAGSRDAGPCPLVQALAGPSRRPSSAPPLGPGAVRPGPRCVRRVGSAVRSLGTGSRLGRRHIAEHRPSAPRPARTRRTRSGCERAGPSPPRGRRRRRPPRCRVPTPASATGTMAEPGPATHGRRFTAAGRACSSSSGCCWRCSSPSGPSPRTMSGRPMRESRVAGADSSDRHSRRRAIEASGQNSLPDLPDNREISPRIAAVAYTSRPSVARRYASASGIRPAPERVLDARPRHADELLDLVRKSGVADEAKLKRLPQEARPNRSAIPTDPAQARRAPRPRRLLTYFQAEQLLQGKWKRFTIGKYKVLEQLGSGGMGRCSCASTS